MTDRDPAAPALLVETSEALAALVQRLSSEPRLALDTEANSLHAFRERVCVVQLSAPGLDAIVDPLAVPDLSPLRALVDRDLDGQPVEVVFHGGDYDITMLSREHGFSFRRVFDTMIAATLIGEERVGLAALVEKSHGVVLTKKYQTSDWARRPFTPPQLEYLRNDTRFLFDLRDRLGAALAAADLVEESEIEFRRLAALRRASPMDDLDAWREMKGADRLGDEGRAVLSRLFAWRDERAKAHDVPRFRILANEVLVALATTPPADANALARFPGLHAVVAEGDAGPLLSAILAGLDAAARGDAPPPPDRGPRSADERARLDLVRDREERVRRWRNDEARDRRVPNVVVLPNVALRSIAESPPPDVATLAANPDVGPKRADRYGETILRVLAGKPPPPPALPTP
jgi:ribonuclease D